MSVELDPFEKSILLLVLTKDIIEKRRLIEQACGYSEDYGNDHLLIKAITNHLNNEEVKPTVARVKEIMSMDSSEAQAKNDG